MIQKLQKVSSKASKRERKKGNCHCNYRGLEILEQLLNQSSHKAIQEYIKLALNRLLSGCPAAQYYINGYLPYTTTLVNTEFWDLSMADTSKGFIPLEELINNAPELNK